MADGANDSEYKNRLLRRLDLRQAVMAALTDATSCKSA
jgi:hypothetical protein